MSKFPEIEKLATIMTADIALRRATAYRSPKFTIKLSRQRRNDRRDKAETMLLTYGVPNFVERRFIKKCLAAGEPFPVKKVQLQYWPMKR